MQVLAYMYLLKYWDYETCLMTIEFEMEERTTFQNGTHL